MLHKLSIKRGLIGPASLLTIGVLYGLSAVITKYLSDYVDAYQVIEYRFGIALLGAVVLMIVLKQKVNFKQFDKKALALFAITFPASAILFTLSVFHSSVALAVFTFYASNVVAQFALGRALFGEQINLHKRLAFVSILLALVAFTNPFSDFALSLGLIYGVASGLVQAVASVFQKQLSTTTNKSSLLVIQAFAGTAMGALILLGTGREVLPALSGFAWLVTIGFGLSMLAIMYLFLVGYKYTNLNVGSILVSSELVFAPLLAYVLISEHMTESVAIGGLLTAAAAVLVNLPEKPKLAKLKAKPAT